MKNTTILAYRNNETWQALHDTVTQKAMLVAQKCESTLITKVFESGTTPEVIDSWIGSIKGECEIVHFILDGTVSDRFKALGFDLKWEKFTALNRYLSINTCDTFNHMPVDQLYATCYSRLAKSLQPDVWVIITDNITDYDPLGEFLKDREFTSSEEVAYVERFKGFIPKDQNVVVCENYTFDPAALNGKKVIVIAHHHAGRGDTEKFLRGTKEGSMWLDTYPSGFLKKLTEVIRTDDLIGGDVIEIIRKRMTS